MRKVGGSLPALLRGLLLLCSLPALLRAQQETLIVTVQPAKAVAGEPFEVQPVVQLLDSSGQPKQVSTGYALVFLDQSPTGFSEIKPPADRGYVTAIGQAPTPGHVRFPFTEGIAIMSGLQIDDVGDEFVLRIESPEHSVQVWTAPFAVALGRAYKVALSVQPGTADGGDEFRPQPTVSIQDKGGNVVTTQNTGTVTVSIALNPVAGVLAAPTNGLTLTFNQGLAPYQALSINTNGSPYSLQFVTDLALDGATRVESFPFTVGVGDAHELRFLVEPAGVAGGTAFVDQPQIEVLDKGGNRLVEDSVSKLRVFIQNNPSGGTISPFDNRLVQLVNGVGTFNNLRIDKAGNDYTMRFYLLKNRRGTQIWDMTNLYLDSANFNVVFGRPQKLVVHTAPANAWAGGSPIGVQPTIEMQDLGGNVLRTDTSSIVTASITPSLAVASSIVVNTALAPATTVGSVRTAKAAGEYGVGEVVDVDVVFSQEVLVTAVGTSAVPTLQLAASASTLAPCTTVGVRSRVLTFRYVVTAGDATADLAYTSVGALVANGAAVLDGNGVAAQLSLPALADANSLGAQAAVQINTAVPKITNVASPLPGDGRYGAGELIDVVVSFDLQVTVTGTPRLQMTLDTTTASAARYATFQSAVTGTNNLLFQYVVQPGDTAAVLGHVTTSIDLAGGATIKRQSTTPTTDADVSLAGLAGSWLQNNNAMVVVTAAPIVDPSVGITVDKPAGTYTVGDIFFIDIHFTEPVTVAGIPRLFLETNPAASGMDTPADYIGIGSGTKTLRFKYEVRLTDATADLDVWSDTALGLNGATVRRHVNRGTAVTDADLSLAAARAAGKSLKDNLLQPGNANFVIDGSIASVTAIGFVMTPCASTGTFACQLKGDTVDIKVTFSADVTVSTTDGTPSIELETSDVDREASYISGSGTSELVFRYTVMLGDDSTLLDYQQQTSLKMKNKYETGASLNSLDGWIRRKSENPTDGTVNVVLPLPSGALSDTAIGTFSVSTGDTGTRITSITTTHTAGTYGVNEVIPITLRFNDEVFTPIRRPALLLNSGADRYAKYDSGYNRDFVKLMYTVQPGDTSASLDVVSTAALLCESVVLASTGETVGGPIKNLGMMIGVQFETPHIDCDLTGLSLQPSGIIIDTSAPQVVSVRSLNPTNSMHGGVYVVGDIITIIVTFNLEVDVREKPELAPDKTPLLLLRTGDAPFATLFLKSYNRKAKYVGYGPGGKKEARFEYRVQRGDYSTSLQYVATNSLDLNSGQAEIKRLSTTPTTDADLTLPLPTSAAGTLAPPGQVIAISGDTDNFIPRVIGVTSTKAAGTYGGGERVWINVTFTMEVVVNCYRDASGTCTRQPYLQLELGEVDRRAYWDPDLKTGESAGTRVITFLYTVQPGDFTYDLDYVDRNSLQLGLGTILHASTNPTTRADLTLPYVGQVGSLGHNNALAIDGLTPYIKRIFAQTADNCQQWLAGICVAGFKEMGDTVDIAVEFSAPVTVIVDTARHGATGTPSYTAALPGLLMFLGLVPDFHRSAPYVSGSGTTQLTFRYTVSTGDATTDLDYVDASAIKLQNHTYIRQLGYTWSVTFESVLKYTKYGNKVEQIDGTARQDMIFGNLPALVPITTSAVVVNASHFQAGEEMIDITDDMAVYQNDPRDWRLNDAPPGVLNGTGKKYVRPTRFPALGACNQKLVGADTDSHDHFGASVGVYGDVAAIGAPGAEDYNIDPNMYTIPGTSTLRYFEGLRLERGAVCGAAYMFRRNTTTFQWSQEAKLLPETPSTAAEFGWSIATDGSITVVGAPGEEENRGAVYIFKYDSVTKRWARAQRLTTDLYNSTSHNGPNNPGQTWSWPKGGRFGHSVGISGDTVVASAIGVNQSIGAVYVIKRTPNKDFQFFQRLHAPALMAGDKFGWSVAVSGNTVVAGAYEHDAYGLDAGAAFTYNRENEHAFFYLTQTLTASDAHRDDRFGRAVSIAKNTVIVSAHQEYTGALTPRAAVQSIIISADSTISGYFRVGYKQYKHGNVWEQKQSRAMQHDISADLLKEFMELDLNTGELLVTRTNPDAQGGHTWQVTFVGAGTYAPVPQLECDSDEDNPLVGSNVDTLVQIENSAMPRLRGNAYVFTRDTNTGSWTEQAALVPKSRQYSEYFGIAASVDHETALVGCLNRDTYVSDINGGAGYFFNLGFLNLAFSQPRMSTVEGSTLTVNVDRCNNARQCHTGTPDGKLEEIVNYDTGDVVSTERTNQLKLKKLLNLGYGALNQLTMPDGTGHYYSDTQFWLDPRQVSTAVERAQSYGGTEQRSIWVNTQYDYVGVSDYAPASGELTFTPNVTRLSFPLLTTDDSLAEAPDEVAMVRLSLPGVLPTYGGKLWATATIADDGDGMTTSPLRAYTNKLYCTDGEPPTQWPSEMASGSQFGYAVSVDAGRGVAIVGAPDKLTAMPGGGTARTGAAYVYELTAGVWSQAAVLQPAAGAIALSRFGVSVAIDGFLGGDVRAVVGAPSNATAFVFVRKLVGATLEWTEETKFQAAIANKPEHRFGQENAVGLHGDYAVVGAPGLEAIYIYQRNTTSGLWSSAVQMRSSDYDYDRILGIDYMHRPQFGCSVDVSWRTVVAGAVRAEYLNTGQTQAGNGQVSVESYDTVGQDPSHSGRGKVYGFYVVPQAQTITLRNLALSDELKAGQWKLSLAARGTVSKTAAIEFNARHSDVQAKLQALSNIDRVTVTRNGNIIDGYTWGVTFNSETEQLVELQVLWNGFGCGECDPFNSAYSPEEKRMEVARIADVGQFKEVWGVQAPDRNPDDRFGGDVALSNHQLVVGASGSSTLTSTTWDFETGDLLGWRKTGTAFDYQPTYGDNSIARSVYDGNDEQPKQTFESYGKGQSARLQGRYYIGTFERRPGKGHVYTLKQDGFNNAKFPGHHRAEEYKDPGLNAPGTAQGDMPQGTLTSQPFVFGGTSIKFRVGGGCSVGGDYWNPLTEHIGGGVYVELLVDGASVVKTTGRCTESMHQEEWKVAKYKGRTGQIRVVDASSSNWGHINFDDVRFDWDVVPERTPNAGAAYAFRMRVANSDKRAEDYFGHSVAVEDSTGLIVVGAKHQVALDHWKMPVKGRPHSGEQALVRVGAAYLFQRVNEQRDGLGNLLLPPYWHSYETARVQAVDYSARDFFSASVAVSENTLFAGATGNDGTAVDGGAAYQMDVEFTRLRFRQAVFPAMENNVDKRVEVSVQRSGDTSQVLVVHYSTSDMTAVGVDKETYDSCSLTPINSRGNECGDYQLTAGDLVFDAGLSSKSFFVPVMDNGCYEHPMEYFKVQLSVPGGGAILGEGYGATVRLDDDDYTADPC
eukprot:g215.t1